MKVAALFSVLLALGSCGFGATAVAQRAYDVFVDGVHPVRVIIGESETDATYRYGNDAGQVLKMAGECTGAACVFVAVDSALALRFAHNEATLEGSLRLGNGRERVLVGTRRFDIDAPLASSCSEGQWLRSFASAGEEYTLVLASLPGGRVRGTLYAQALATSFPVAGDVDGEQLALAIARNNGTPGGWLRGQLTNGGLLATLQLAATESEPDAVELDCDLLDELGLACLQDGGNRDLTYATTDDTGADLELSRRVKLWWRALTAEFVAFDAEVDGDQGDATGWFEPVRLDKAYLSGWQHLHLPDGTTESHAVTIDRARGRLLRGSMSLAQSRREREARRTNARRRAIAAHPLADNEDFLAWADTQELSEFAVAVEGLAFGGAHHPVYGQLRYTEPWESLEPSRGLAGLLPDWLRNWIGGVPAERP